MDPLSRAQEGGQRPVKPPRRSPGVPRRGRPDDAGEPDAGDSEPSEGLGGLEASHSPGAEASSTSSVGSEVDTSQSRFEGVAGRPPPSNSPSPENAAGKLTFQASVHQHGLRKGRLRSPEPEARFDEKTGKTIFSITSLRALAEVVTRIRRRLGSES
jgi:hypothetical protein